MFRLIIVYFSCFWVLACTDEQPVLPAQTKVPSAPFDGKKHGIFIVIDTLRNDALLHADTPNLDRLATSGHSAKFAWSASTWTIPAVISMFLGKPVREHGWDLPMPKFMALAGKSYPEMPPGLSLAERFQAEGIKTHAYVSNPILSVSGLKRGFEHWNVLSEKQIPPKLVADFSELNSGERQFIYIHLFGPHQPLQPSVESRMRWGIDDKWLDEDGRIWYRSQNKKDPAAVARYKRAYHAVVEEEDARIGAIFEILKPLLSDSVIVLTSDHGEFLGEGGQFGHPKSVYEELARVPFLVKGGPELPELLVNSVVPDVFCRGMGVDQKWSSTLENQKPLITQREGFLALTLDSSKKTVWDPNFREFDLLKDPEEENPLPGRKEIQLIRKKWEADTPMSTAAPVDARLEQSVQRALKKMGYLD